jgi:hypothetical protein
MQQANNTAQARRYLEINLSLSKMGDGAATGIVSAGTNSLEHGGHAQ